jgi:hypothetical protein
MTGRGARVGEHAAEQIRQRKRRDQVHRQRDRDFGVVERAHNTDRFHHGSVVDEAYRFRSRIGDGAKRRRQRSFDPRDVREVDAHEPAAFAGEPGAAQPADAGDRKPAREQRDRQRLTQPARHTCDDRGLHSPVAGCACTQPAPGSTMAPSDSAIITR